MKAWWDWVGVRLQADVCGTKATQYSVVTLPRRNKWNETNGTEVEQSQHEVVVFEQVTLWFSEAETRDFLLHESWAATTTGTKTEELSFILCLPLFLSHTCHFSWTKYVAELETSNCKFSLAASSGGGESSCLYQQKSCKHVRTHVFCHHSSVNDILWVCFIGKIAGKISKSKIKCLNSL